MRSLMAAINIAPASSNQITDKRGSPAEPRKLKARWRQRRITADRAASYRPIWKRRSLRWLIFFLLAFTLPALLILATPVVQAQSETANKVDPSPRNVIAVVPRSWPPQYSVDENGKPFGFAIDVMNEIAARADFTVTYVVADNFSVAVDILRRGDADLIPNSGIVAERMDTFAFTAPVETFVVSVFVRNDTDDFNSASDLVGQKLAVVEKNIGLFMFGKRKDINVHIYQDVQSALFELISGQVDALVYPKPVLLRGCPARC